MIREVVSDAIASKLNDPRIAPFASITRVEMSADLEHAKVWVSVMGEEQVQRRTMAGLKSAAPLIQRMVARELPLRHCPRLHFVLDESIKRGAETIRLIREAMAELEPPAEEAAEERGDDSPGDDA